MKTRTPLDPARKVSEGGHPEHRLALTITCHSCKAPAGEWCPMSGTTWNLCGDRINAARGYDERGKGCDLPAEPSKEVIKNRIERIEDAIARENHWWNNHRHLWITNLTVGHDKIAVGYKREIIDLKALLK